MSEHQATPSPMFGIRGQKSPSLGSYARLLHIHFCFVFSRVWLYCPKYCVLVCVILVVIIVSVTLQIHYAAAGIKYWVRKRQTTDFFLIPDVVEPGGRSPAPVAGTTEWWSDTAFFVLAIQALLCWQQRSEVLYFPICRRLSIADRTCRHQHAAVHRYFFDACLCSRIDSFSQCILRHAKTVNGGLGRRSQGSARANLYSA